MKRPQAALPDSDQFQLSALPAWHVRQTLWRVGTLYAAQSPGPTRGGASVLV